MVSLRFHKIVRLGLHLICSAIPPTVIDGRSSTTSSNKSRETAHHFMKMEILSSKSTGEYLAAIEKEILLMNMESSSDPTFPKR